MLVTMIQRRGAFHFIFLLCILSCIATVLAAKPTSFCKCTCFSNSTIIELRPPDLDSASPDFNGHSVLRRDGKETGRSLSCNDCNRKFCLEYNLPTCRGAKEEDVVTTCFQRDSRKDEVVVFIFIFATSSLLVWAGVKPWAQRWIEVARERRSYIPVSENTER
ncbi:hypothetical protein VTN77DRAFT_3536 [Rasamsonia byssochlamydoides]|uniref:uncharacterized protein n=1 Tax=Rasamsonia byssochlamydoides TaxID=89139 RepID=UPI003743A449